MAHEVTVHRIEPDGRLGEMTDHVEHAGSGPDPVRQANSHVHMIASDPVTGDILVSDLGSDTVFVYGLDDDGRDYRLAGLDASILAGKTDLLGVGILALEAEFGPGCIDQLNLLGGRSAGGRSCSRWRRLSGRCGCRGSGFRRLRSPGLRRRGRGCLSLGIGRKQCGGQGCRRKQGENPPTRPDRRGQDTKIHCGKPFLNGSARNRCGHRHLAVWAAVSLPIEADT